MATPPSRTDGQNSPCQNNSSGSGSSSRQTVIPASTLAETLTAAPALTLGQASSGHPAGTMNPEYCETIVNMLTMLLSCTDHDSSHRAILAITKGCIPLLVQIMYPTNLPADSHPTTDTKNRAAVVLKNIVMFNTDERVKRSELMVLKLLDAIRTFAEELKNGNGQGERHPVQSSKTLMQLSYDDDNKNTICLLGGIHTLADLILTDHTVHGIVDNTEDCVMVRRYSGMTLSNLTLVDGANKTLLCGMKDFMSALVAQLDSQNEDICQVTAAVLRNLSWHADSASRAALRDSDAVAKLTNAAIKSSREPTLKAALSALLNLSTHSIANETIICRIPNAVSFLVGLLNSKSKSLAVVENAGLILKNIVTTIPNDDEIREVFRSCGLIEILLENLKSSSLIVVSNACGMLWHLSANCQQDQHRLFELGADSKLKALAYSKHHRIAQGASAALKNMLNYATEQNASPQLVAENQEPMDLRKSSIDSSRQLNLAFQDEPLDLSLHSTQSSPIHVVSKGEFGPRSTRNPAYHRNLQGSASTGKKYSRKNFNSCPEFNGSPLPAHRNKATEGRTNQKSRPPVEDSTIDYSLHYSESSTDESRTQKSEDTVKTYCIEGTPLNISTSNSMSDLTQVDKPPKLKPIVEAANDVDLPRKYCTEHTPANFSRTSSLSSIASNTPRGGENKTEFFEEAAPLPIVVNGGTNEGDGNGKEKVKRNVTFSAQETPLMFSRSSSINSIDSVEITYEDDGSVVSEFSRRQSEVVSPSDLPDSPRQICAPASASLFMDKPVLPLEVEEAKQEDTVKHFNSCESGAVSGLVSVRSLSPLFVDGEEVGVKMKLDSSPPALVAPKPSGAQSVLPPTSDAPHQDSDVNKPKIFAVEGTPFVVSNATSISDIVGELEGLVEEEKPADNGIPASLTPPKEEPIYSDAQMLQKCIKAGKAARIPKSKSEFSKLNIKDSVKTSQSYHESLKPSYIDPHLAELIQEGKSRVRGLRRPPRGNDEQNPRTNNKVDLEFKGHKVSKDTKKIENPSILKEQIPINQQSTTSIASEWNDETPTISSPIPSMSISTAFRNVERKHEEPRSELQSEDAGVISTLSSMQPPSGFSNLVSSTDCKKKFDSESSNLFNQVPPADFDLENSMISVASLKSEIASVASARSGVRDMSIGGETYTIGGGSDSDAEAVTDADDSLIEDINSLDEMKIVNNPQEFAKTSSSKLAGPTQERFLTFTKRQPSPRQKRKEDPSRYLTRTISPHDSNGNLNSNILINQFATFKIDKTSRVVKKQTSATSNESLSGMSPSGSPKGLRGRRRNLYSSLPSQKRIAPPVPPKTGQVGASSVSVFVRPTRASALRAAVAGSHDSSSKNSSKNSSSSSLNNFGQSVPSYNRKTPPKPPVRTSLSSPSKNFACVRPVRNSSSSIGFTSEIRPNESGFNSLPRPGEVKLIEPCKVGNISKLSNLWNQLTKPKTDSSKYNQSSSTEYGIDKLPNSSEKKSSKFGFPSFGKKKKDIWFKREPENETAKPDSDKALIRPFSHNNVKPEPSGAGSSNSKMTTV